MNKNLKLGLWKYLLPIPRPIWQGRVAQDTRHTSEHGLAFMSEDHHRVRDFVVVELPRLARPLSAALIAERLNLPFERVTEILDNLEKHMTFLYRNRQGEVTWAYPVTVDHTPHRVTFSSGEKIYAA
jgi:hypothetical protein